MWTTGEVFCLLYIFVGIFTSIIALLAEDDFRNTLFYENDDGFYLNVSIFFIVLIFFIFWPLGIYLFVCEKATKIQKHLQNRNNKDD